MILSSLYSSAQSLVNKDGDTILPKAKEWSIGLDATKLIKQARFDFVSTTQAITVKYMKDAHTAYRLGARIGVNSYVTKEKEIDRLAQTSTVIAYPAPKALKQNSWQRNASTFGVSFGIEKRRGSTRLQGIYGAEGGIFISTLRDRFSYGNALNANPSSPIIVTSDDAMSSNVFGSANNIDTVPNIQGVQGSARILERKNSAAVSIGARLFIGAEYFFLPKMSIGGEFGWGLSLNYAGRVETKYESIGQSNIQGNTAPSVNRTTIDGGTNNSTFLDTDNGSLIGGASASLRINLYF
jgi:hypothetical protein